MTDFALQLRTFATKAKHNADRAVSNVVGMVADEIDARSPVGDAKLWKHPPPPGYIGGQFRGNWQLGVNEEAVGPIARIDPSGAETVAEIKAGIPGHTVGNIFYLTNSLPYANRIENGWSTQAPVGVVGLTVASFEVIVEEAIAGGLA